MYIICHLTGQLTISITLREPSESSRSDSLTVCLSDSLLAWLGQPVQRSHLHNSLHLTVQLQSLRQSSGSLSIPVVWRRRTGCDGNERMNIIYFLWNCPDTLSTHDQHQTVGDGWAFELFGCFSFYFPEVRVNLWCFWADRNRTNSVVG